MTNLWHSKDGCLHAAFNRSGYRVQKSNKIYLFFVLHAGVKSHMASKHTPEKSAYHTAFN